MRELLHYAGLLHDIGIFISFTKHNVHSHYLIQNSEMLGFTQKEVSLMAALALFHRYGYSRKDKVCAALAEDWQEHARYLSLFLSLAEAMDKSHRQAVVSAIVRPARSGACARHARHGALSRGAGADQALPQALEKCFGKTDMVWEASS